MMKILRLVCPRYVVVPVVIGLIFPIVAHSSDMSVGRILSEPAGARIAALGESVIGLSGDISVFPKNPAQLITLSGLQLCTQFQHDSLGSRTSRLSVGAPLKKGGLGLSIAYFDAGSIDVVDNSAPQTVHAQRDMAATLGMAYGHSNLSGGVSLKYLSSELGEQARGTAWAVDAGLQAAVNARVRLGVSMRNWGSDLRYAHERNSLPRSAAAGFAWTLKSGSVNFQLLGESGYRPTSSDFRSGLGMEIGVGLLRLGAGLQSVGGHQEISIGTGVLFGSAELNYSFGMLQNNEAQNRISMTYAFGKMEKDVSIVNSPNPERGYGVQFDEVPSEINFSGDMK